MNYGEEYGYWYLRLNGFFPIADFVMHGAKTIDYTTDCDLLAVRPPNVVEDIGGNYRDWDEFLGQHFGNYTIGMICQVKTGNFQKRELFPQAEMRYVISRLGLCNNPERAALALENKAVIDPEPNVRLIKLLIATNPVNDPGFLSLQISHVVAFLVQRFRRYEEKFRDRMFFHSLVIQGLIHQTRQQPKG